MAELQRVAADPAVQFKDISEGKLPKDATWTLFRTSDCRDLPEIYGRALAALVRHTVASGDFELTASCALAKRTTCPNI